MRSPALKAQNRKRAWGLLLAAVACFLASPYASHAFDEARKPEAREREREGARERERETICSATEKSYAALVSNLVERGVAEARVAFESELVEQERCRGDLDSHELKAPAQYPLSIVYAPDLPRRHVSAIKAAIEAWNQRAGGDVFVDDEVSAASIALRQVDDAWRVPARCGVVWVTTQPKPNGAGRTKRDGCSYTVRLHEPTAAQHELGHVLGLEHSSDPRDLMYPIHWERPLKVSEYERCLVQGALQRAYLRR